MYHSGEIRWFFRDGPQSEVDRWFSDCDAAVSEAPRRDSYIILPRCTTAGVKIRQGNIEVKAQTQPASLVQFADRVRGYQDSWVKWSRPASDPESFLAAPTIPERWAHVEKERTLRLLSLETEVPEEIEAGSRHLSAGCQAERTLLRVLVSDEDTVPGHAWGQAERWWSLSLEAFGSPDAVAELLLRAATHWFSENFPAALRAEDSMSYPQWLARLEDTRL